MSLINQMLKDLESRRNPALPDGSLMSGERPVAASRGPRPLTLILVVLVLLLALGLGYVWQQNSQLQTVTPSQSPVATVSAPLIKAQPATTPTPSSAKRVVATPQRSASINTAPLPALVAKSPAEVPRATAADARLRGVSPSVVDGSWEARDFTLRGESLGAPLQVVVSWGSKEKILPNYRVQWLDSNTARINLVTGNADEIWHIALIYPDGRRSNPVDFEVIASPYARNSRTTTHSTRSATTLDGQMKKVIRPPSSHEQADQLYQQGYHALQQRNSDSAEQLWQRALKTEPSHLKSREGLIALTLSQGRKVEASKLLEEAVAHHPQSGQFAMLHARLLAEQGDTAAAISALEQAMGHNEQQPQLFALAAALYQQQRSFDNSIRAYQRALQLQPHQANWWMGLAISLESAAKNEEAISAYKEAQQRGGLNSESKNYVQQRLEALD